MSFKPGSVVGDYTVLGSVGAGGMGTVYKVQHVITKRIEAMKLLASGKADPDQEQRFVREMQVQARLHHPNIAEVYNAFRFYDEFFMVMEFIEGESLEQVLAKQRPPLETGIGYARQALAALAYAHGNGVVHRDIAPANMIITPEGTVKLTDFGLAKTATDVRLTQSGAPVGSPWYMSPEQVRGGAELDARSDIYSLGAVLYEIVTGHKVFNRETAFDVMRAQVELPPVAPIEREPHLPV
ncbi:MAG TPA: serine/threonine-protein kinase, partial [Bryobacteraceae bacterium]|nr:serine/threonine-protein kinase [Bryobacteraceae bacterium]